jgi:L-ascorbate metabolism protein UlaG (beta-lactamase superfamily)
VERLTWLGHATVLLETGGARILTDPVLGRRVAHLRRQTALPASPGQLDAILVSHLHHDHLDPRSVRTLDGGALLVVPRGAGRSRAIRSLGHEVHELGPGETLALGDVRVRAVPAIHDGKRLPMLPESPALGFVVEGPSRMYFAGDTALFDEMRTLVEGLDVALLPVWGWGGRLGPGHMNPDEAAQAAALLRPRIAVPIHWGTFLPYGAAKSHDRFLRAPGSVFAERVAHRAPEVQVVVLAPGESLDL